MKVLSGKEVIMNHNILFQTKEGSFLVFVCVGKYIYIEDELRERIDIDNITFEKKEDVTKFMDKYIEDMQKSDYSPYWQFEDIIIM